MLMFAMEEKTEKATPKHKEDARKKGQVFKSTDLNGAILLLAMFGVLKVGGSYIVNQLKAIIIKYCNLFGSVSSSTWDTDSIYAIFIDVSISFFMVMIPIILVSLIVSVLSSYAQIGHLNTTEPLKPKFDKINPINGFKRIFTMRSIVELLKSILKFTILVNILYGQMKKNYNSFPTLAGVDLDISIKFMVDFIMGIAFKLGFALLCIGVVDYFYQRWEYEKGLRMTKQEIKEEYKQIEGDPKIKGKIRQKQQEVSMMRMMTEVPSADVVITNPTHYAIAIKYDENKSAAPIVVAKGKDFVARKIKEKAKENKIEMIENKPLAQALYATVEVGEQIPSEFYAAVAEILVKIYNLKNSGRRN